MHINHDTFGNFFAHGPCALAFSVAILSATSFFYTHSLFLVYTLVTCLLIIRTHPSMGEIALEIAVDVLN